jgi:hypothetical protein
VCLERRVDLSSHCVSNHVPSSLFNAAINHTVHGTVAHSTGVRHCQIPTPAFQCLTCPIIALPHPTCRVSRMLRGEHLGWRRSGTPWPGRPAGGTLCTYMYTRHQIAQAVKRMDQHTHTHTVQLPLKPEPPGSACEQTSYVTWTGRAFVGVVVVVASLYARHLQ